MSDTYYVVDVWHDQTRVWEKIGQKYITVDSAHEKWRSRGVRYRVIEVTQRVLEPEAPAQIPSVAESTCELLMSQQRESIDQLQRQLAALTKRVQQLELQTLPIGPRLVRHPPNCTCGNPWHAVIPPPPCPIHGPANTMTVTCGTKSG